MARKPHKNATRGPFRRHFLREWRDYRGITQERLAARVGTTASNISQIETGKQGYTQPMLEALADALDTDPGSIMMRNPLDQDAVWSIAERLAKMPETVRRQALAVIDALQKTGTNK